MSTTPSNIDTTATGIALHPGMVDYVDLIVGRLTSAIKDLGIDRETVVILATDNGSPGLKARMKGLDVVGGKTKLTESGICVPFMVSCPGRIAKGAVRDDLADFSDILPTVLDLAGAKSPTSITLDGRSFASVLRDASTAEDACEIGHECEPREWIYSQLGANRVIRDKRYKLWSDGRFFDLTEDPLEQKDLALSDNPEHRVARERLAKTLDSLPPDKTLPFNRPKGAE